jgi:hypothetical protein
MAYRYAQFRSDQNPGNYAYDVNPVAIVLSAVALSVVWPVGWCGTLTLFFVTKTDREQVEWEKRKRSIERARLFLQEQEERLKTDFDAQVKGGKPATEATPIRRALARAGMKRRNIGGPW